MLEVRLILEHGELLYGPGEQDEESPFGLVLLPRPERLLLRPPMLAPLCDVPLPTLPLLEVGMLFILIVVSNGA